MSFQFIHIEAYALTGSVRKTKVPQAKGQPPKTVVHKKWSVSEILDEAARQEGACPHVMEPKPPKVLWGVKPADVLAKAQRWAASAKDAQGRKLRCDGLCLLAGVVSFPAERSKEWPAFKMAALMQLRKQYGPQLVSVVEHLDEAHPHLHFYVVPQEGARFESVHPGRLAAAKKAQEGAKKGAQNAAYCEAMRGFQDEFASAVGARFGLARLGPGRRRLSRAAWQAEKAQAMALAQPKVPNEIKLWPKDLTRQITQERLLMPDDVETNAEYGKRLNRVLIERVQPLVTAARNGLAAVAERDHLAQAHSEQAVELEALRSQVAQLKEEMALFTPEQLAFAQLKRQREHEEQLQREKDEQLRREQQAQQAKEAEREKQEQIERARQAAAQRRQDVFKVFGHIIAWEIGANDPSLSEDQVKAAVVDLFCDFPIEAFERRGRLALPRYLAAQCVVRPPSVEDAYDQMPPAAPGNSPSLRDADGSDPCCP